MLIFASAANKAGETANNTIAPAAGPYVDLEAATSPKTSAEIFSYGAVAPLAVAGAVGNDDAGTTDARLSTKRDSTCGVGDEKASKASSSTRAGKACTVGGITAGLVLAGTALRSSASAYNIGSLAMDSHARGAVSGFTQLDKVTKKWGGSLTKCTVTQFDNIRTKRDSTTSVYHVNCPRSADPQMHHTEGDYYFQNGLCHKDECRLWEDLEAPLWKKTCIKSRNRVERRLGGTGTEILQKTGQRPLSRIVEERRLRYYGYVVRYPPERERWVRKVLSSE
eukprot:g5883.t1